MFTIQLSPLRALRLPVAGLTLAVLGGCGLPGQAETPEERSPIDATELGEVQSCFLCCDVYLGSLPDKAALELASRRGIRTVIDVTPLGFESDFSIAASAREHDLSYVRIAIDPGRVTDEQVDAALAVLSNPERGLSFLFGVTSGAPALLMGIYRSHFGGVELEQAIDDALRVGMEPGELEVTFRAQVDRLDQARSAVFADYPGGNTAAEGTAQEGTAQEGTAQEG